MAIPALWIRQHMFASTFDESNRTDSPNRRLTEAELRVKRSLEKLSIPEWYLNKSSKPPKILMNDSPIESRPASWKTYRKNSSMSALTTKTFKGSNKSVSSEAQNSIPSYKPYRNHQPSHDASKTSDTSMIAHHGTLERRSKQKKRLNTSGTFPRMSVSRKLQNINIVFPPSPKLDLSIENLNDLKLSPTMDDPPAESKQIMVTDLDDPDPECFRIRRATYTKPSSPKKLDNPDCSIIPCRTPEFKSPALMKFKVRTSSTPQGSPVSVFSTSAMDSSLAKPINRESVFTFPDIVSCSPLAKPLPQTSPKPFKKPSFFPPSDDESSKPPTEAPPPLPSLSSSPQPSPPPESTPLPTSRRAFPRPLSVTSIRSETIHLCDSCKADNIRIRVIMVSPASSSPRTSPTFRSPLLPIAEDGKMALSRHSSNASSNIAFIISKKKSTALENIIKKKRVGEKGSLIQDIIDELQEKCRTSPQQTYTSPGSRNFVRKLVKALERHDDNDDKAKNTQALIRRNREVEYNSESSDGDIKSAASSTTLSYKDSDSGSDSEPRSPLSSEPDYDWAVNAKKEEEKLQEDESVFWVPVKKSLPRTSSMLSILNNSATGGQSPCISPIKVQNGRKTFQWGNASDTWGNTYRQTKSQKPKRLIKIDESGVLDSGYSDRSERSSATDAGAFWSDFENTQSPSEFDTLSGSYCRSRKVLQKTNAFIGQSILV